LSQQPVPGTCSLRNDGAGSSVVPYLALHPMGFSVPPRLRSERWALTPPFHPCRRPCKHERWRFVFCGTFRQDASRRRFPRISCSQTSRLRGIAPFGVRTFLPSESLRRSDPPPFQNRLHDTVKIGFIKPGDRNGSSTNEVRIKLRRKRKDRTNVRIGIAGASVPVLGDAPPARNGTAKWPK
jgi:hypothetical protein